MILIIPILIILFVGSVDSPPTTYASLRAERDRAIEELRIDRAEGGTCTEDSE